MINIKKTELLRLNQNKIKDKNILMRVDFNIPIKNGHIYELYRIKSIKETLNFLKPTKKIVLISHWGDPISKEKNYSLKRILPILEKILKTKIGFLENLDSKIKEKINLLENIRFFKGEKECDLNFAKKLSTLGEVFVFEAFSVAHRKHSSVYLLPKILKTYYGFNFEKEIKLLNEVLKNCKKPKINKNRSLALILGGAKISTKFPLIKKFLKYASLIILGGGLANTLLKAKGFEIGKSLFEKEFLKDVKKIKSHKILAPFDFYVINKNKIYYRLLGEIKKEDKILDIGEKSLNIFLEEIKKVKFIVFNGPLGFVEDKKFELGTLKLVKFLSKFKNKFILVGGGDTLNFLEKKKLLNKFKISTGGGAMLYYLANETFPIFSKK